MQSTVAYGHRLRGVLPQVYLRRDAGAVGLAGRHGPDPFEESSEGLLGRVVGVPVGTYHERLWPRIGVSGHPGGNVPVRV